MSAAECRTARKSTAVLLAQRMRHVYVVNACQSCAQPRYRLRSNRVCVLLVSYRPLARLNARESWKPRPGGTPSNPLVGALLASVFIGR